MLQSTVHQPRPILCLSHKALQEITPAFCWRWQPSLPGYYSRDELRISLLPNSSGWIKERKLWFFHFSSLVGRDISESARAPGFLAWDFALSHHCYHFSFPYIAPTDNPPVNINANAKGNAEEMSSCLVWHNPLYLGCIGKILFSTVKADISIKVVMKKYVILCFFKINLQGVHRKYQARRCILAKINACIWWGYKSSLKFSSTVSQKLRQHNIASCCLVFRSLELSQIFPVSKVSINFGYPNWNSLKIVCFKK